MALDAALRAPIERWLARRHGSTDGITTLRYRRVYILPTQAGFAFGGLLLLIWLGAINYSNNLTFMLTFLLAGVAIAGMHHAFHNLVGLRVVPGQPEPVFAGQPIAFPVTLENDRTRQRTAIELTTAGGNQAIDVAAKASAEATLYVPSTTRGRQRAGRIQIATRYPSGLFRAWSWVVPSKVATIYPLPEAGNVPPPGATGSGGTARVIEGDDDFSGLRRYQRGDPLSRVAWKATHVRELQVKTFTGLANEQLTLRWDATVGLSHEARIARLTRWVLEAERAGHRYALELPGNRIPLGSAPTHRHRCLTALAMLP